LLQHHAFEGTVDRSPDQSALDDGGRTLSYALLESRANRLAYTLRALGCGPSQRICLLTGKNASLYTAVLGTLKAGGCWVPLGTDWPPERVAALLASLRPVALVVDADHFPLALEVRRRLPAELWIVLLNATNGSADPRVADQTEIDRAPADRPAAVDLTPEDLAYIIFTSGSTGTPKGVMVRHRSTVHFLEQCRGFFPFEPALRFAHVSEITFDPSVFDLFHCWQSGGTVVPFNRRRYRVNPALFLKDAEVNVLFTVPGVIARIMQAGRLGDPCNRSVRHLLLTGEAVPPQLVRAWLDAHPATAIYNMYGTTETAIVSHWCRLPHDLPENGPVPVGRPLDGMRVLLLDGDQPVEAGEVGESVVCGAQLSAGYWDNPYQTNARFRPYPIDSSVPVTVYRTGDLLRMAADGLYYFIGRQDDQIKLRGHRVELGEVESCLLMHETISEAAAVVVRQDGSEDRLVVFVRGTSRSLDSTAVLIHLRERLPAYMIPSHIEVTSWELPRNPNGKNDRQALLSLAVTLLGSELENA
jgi:D-alanine--poly(phosphoribitol) ligase subunit 1